MLAQAIVLFLVADWLLNNDWLSRHKHTLRHPAAWIHALIHGLCMAVIFSAPVAIILALTHMLIDTRIPVVWWCRVTRKTLDGPWGMPVLIMNDQVLHLVSLAIACRAIS